jgi:TorA maturation chaperone TorD
MPEPLQELIAKWRDLGTWPQDRTARQAFHRCASDLEAALPAGGETPETKVLREVKAHWDKFFVGDYCPVCSAPTCESQHADDCLYRTVKALLLKAGETPLQDGSKEAEVLRQLLRDYEASAEREAESLGRYEWFWVDEIENRIKQLSGSKEWRTQARVASPTQEPK